MKTAFLILSFVAATPVWSLHTPGRRTLQDLETLEGVVQSQEYSKEKRQSGPADIPFTTFDRNQRVAVTGEYKWVAPGPTDIRGPCPGLNALANHGYFPHNGVVPLQLAVTATNLVYGARDCILLPTLSMVLTFVNRACSELCRTTYRLRYFGRWQCRVSCDSTYELIWVTDRSKGINPGVSEANRHRHLLIL